MSWLLGTKMRTTSLCLVTSDLVSVLKVNYAGEVGQFVCYTNKAKASVNVYDRFSNTSVLDHARKVSEIKKSSHGTIHVLYLNFLILF